MLKQKRAGETTNLDFSVCYQTHHQVLFLFFLKHYDHCNVEDLIHDTFVKMLKQNATVLSGVKCIRSYILRVARNVLIDRTRLDKYRQHESLDLDKHSPPDLESDPELQQQFTEISILLIEVFEQLSQRKRQCFTLHRVEGFSYSQIAKQLGISMAVVEKEMMSVLKTIKHKIDRQC